MKCKYNCYYLRWQPLCYAFDLVYISRPIVVSIYHTAFSLLAPLWILVASINEDSPAKIRNNMICKIHPLLFTYGLCFLSLAPSGGSCITETSHPLVPDPSHSGVILTSSNYEGLHVPPSSTLLPV